MLASRTAVATAAALRGAVRCASSIRVDNPYTGEIVAEVPFATAAEARATVHKAAAAQKSWASSSLDARLALCREYIGVVQKNKDAIAKELSMQMGKPLDQAKGEVNGLVDRTKGMMALAPAALAAQELPPNGDLVRRIVREPVGVVFAIAPWNYPLLCAVNVVVPAILAGNSVVLKMSPRTPATARSAFERAFITAGAPEGLVCAVDVDNDVSAGIISEPSVGFVSFTGSVSAGRSVYQTVAGSRFIDATLELGGCDAAYVAEDANLEKAVDTVVDGAMYNAGQSCCGIQRVFVHRSLYAKFLEASVAMVKGYKLGDPLVKGTSMGPIALPQTPAFLASVVSDASAKGAKVLVGGAPTTDETGRGRFFAPTVLADCTQDMAVMRDEAFGPIFAVTAVDSDAEAVQKINDSQFGLTAAVFTTNMKRFQTLGPQLSVGTVYMNRCDYLDPMLPWTGARNSGKGISLSEHGFRGVTRLKGYNMRLP